MDSFATTVQQLARPAVRDLVPYSSARSLYGGQDAILLDANESPADPLGQGTGLNRYPHPQPPPLIVAMADLYGVSTDRVFAGRGTDEAIDTLLRTFCEASEDSILVCPPTYGLYEVAANIQGAKVKEVPLLTQSFALNAAGILDAWDERCKLVFLCSPNNPTGNTMRREDVAAVCQGLQDKAVVVLDEAYIEFCPDASMTGTLASYPNLVVLRTLSKAWGMAGARVGVALGHPSLIALMNKVRAPYPLAKPVIDQVMPQLTAQGREQCLQRSQEVMRRREQLNDRLNGFACVEQVYPSEANFVLARFKDAQAASKACREGGVIVRDLGKRPGLDNCVRISVGTDAELQQLFGILEGLS